jgi:hypothetical protein
MSIVCELSPSPYSRAFEPSQEERRKGRRKGCLRQGGMLASFLYFILVLRLLGEERNASLNTGYSLEGFR